MKVVRFVICAIEAIFLLVVGIFTFYVGVTEPNLRAMILVGILSVVTLVTLVGYFAIAEGRDLDDDEEYAQDERLLYSVDKLIERAEAVTDYSLKTTALRECRRQLEEFQAITDYFDDLAERYDNAGLVRDTCAGIALLRRQFNDNVEIIRNLYEVVLKGGVADSDVRQIDRCLNSNQKIIIQAQNLQLSTVRYINTLFHNGGTEQYNEDVVNAFNYAMLARIDQAAVQEMDRQVGELNATMTAVMSKVARVKENLNLS